MGLPIHKRRFYAFISHAQADKSIVDQIESWLTNKAGIPVWYDAHFLPSGAEIASELGRVIEQCQSIILILSQRSVKSGWVKEEFDASSDQRAQSKETFRIIPICIEECEVPDFLQNTKWIDISKTGFDLAAASELLLSLHSIDPELELGSTRDIFISRSWHAIPETESLLADMVCEHAKRMGFRLIGDAPDWQGFHTGDRVRNIIASCGGLIAVLPERGAGKTSQDMLQEIEFASALGLPYVIVAEDTVEVEGPLANNAIEIVRVSKARMQAQDNLSKLLHPAIINLWGQWKTPPAPHYIFYGTDLDEAHKERTQIVRRVIQRVSAMPCLVGEDIRQGQIQNEIVRRISGAFMMLADISADNMNTCIEAGIAMGAKIPLHLVASEPRHKPPFMFRDRQVWYYKNDIDLLGIVHNLVYPYRRQVINDELQVSLSHRDGKEYR